MKLLLATNNLHKIREFRLLLKQAPGLDLFTLLDYPDYEAPPEDGATFEANATIKAVDCAKQLNVWSLADDSGLVVPALNGQPGVFSARYCGSGASDKENRDKLLREMSHLQGAERSAYFECCLVLADSSGQVRKVATGTVHGLICEEARGSNGFGYDPLFIKYDYDKTFAQLSEDVKNRISHRYKALEKMLAALLAMSGQEG